MKFLLFDLFSEQVDKYGNYCIHYLLDYKIIYLILNNFYLNQNKYELINFNFKNNLTINDFNNFNENCIENFNCNENCKHFIKNNFKKIINLQNLKTGASIIHLFIANYKNKINYSIFNKTKFIFENIKNFKILFFCKLNQYDYNGFTPIHLCIDLQKYKLGKLLLQWKIKLFLDLLKFTNENILHLLFEQYLQNSLQNNNLQNNEINENKVLKNKIEIKEIIVIIFDQIINMKNSLEKEKYICVLFCKNEQGGTIFDMLECHNHFCDEFTMNENDGCDYCKNVTELKLWLYQKYGNFIEEWKEMDIVKKN
ncbi:hypothetical protein ABK040_007364 [Willaertia magna]